LNIPGFSSLTYRIFVPPDATRWQHAAIHEIAVQLFLEQGTLPTLSVLDHKTFTNLANSSFDQYLLTGWPWVTNQSYYLVITNTLPTAKSFFFAMQGKNAQTDDDDGDGMLDAIERLYFGNTAQTAGGDFDNDGVNNRGEINEGTNPADRNSLRPR